METIKYESKAIEKQSSLKINEEDKNKNILNTCMEYA